MDLFIIRQCAHYDGAIYYKAVPITMEVFIIKQCAHYDGAIYYKAVCPLRWSYLL